MLLAFFGLSPVELLIVGVVAVLLFGSRLPSVARSAGKSLTEFRRGMQDLQDEFRGAMHEAEDAVRPKAAQLTQAADADAHDGAEEADESEAPDDNEEPIDPALAAGYPEATKPPYSA